MRRKNTVKGKNIMPAAPKSKRAEIALTERERQVLKLLVDGYSNVEASEILNLSRRTVEAHRARIMLKLNIHELPALVKYAIRTGLTTVNEHRYALE